MRRLTSYASAAGLLLASTAATSAAQRDCDIRAQDTFGKDSVVLAVQPGSDRAAAFVLFRSALRVNTDGAPNSYHPFDLEGSSKAINNIANGVAIYRLGGNQPVSYRETIAVFGKFRDANWMTPAGYRIDWQNVIAASKLGGRTVPCVFQSGDDKGYFGSLTALQNGLPLSASGECQTLNQLDERYIPALVIPGGNNPVKRFGAGLGDLVVAVNPANGAAVAAVIGDSGPPDNLGEGSVALNMALTKQTKQPANWADAKKLNVDKSIVAIMPRTAEYRRERPYSAANIDSRVRDWLTEHGYGKLQDFVNRIVGCAQHI